MFVLLEHDAPDGVHWDFIIEVPGCEHLPTWRLLNNPLAAPGENPAERIADHPPHFLEYEGALRAGLGSVRRLDRGEAEITEFAAGVLRAKLFGESLRGGVEILIPDASQTNRGVFKQREHL